ncbi:dihydroorotate dehydrogenase [Thermodesulfatator autotrophicus]|uniref:Dihydroorotate dehydrogenase n=1 Tax=Thermodesulfatator autotrophicus TaxID=1795632 RepID=A0A177E982_9BACT|nr:dihydroorotate dehydrogenase [Thermodesulfatator autotrophicus]OAG28513.1 dihydroorotate dehydrogenase [Thermodesulfatator autotrophicus]
MDLTVKIAGLTFKNPVLLASGTWGFGEKLKNYLDLSSLGGLVTKGISLKPREGNPPPRIAETPCGLINAIGLENPGVEIFKKHVLPPILAWKTHVLVNIFGETIDEFLAVAEALKDEPISGLELNVSCPNVAKGGLAFGHDPATVKALVEELRKTYPGFLVVKLPPVGPVLEVARTVLEAGADALTVANTYPALAVDLTNRRLALGRGTGGLSGPAIKPLTLKLVYDLYRELKAPIFGCGGITSGRDVLEYIFCGAKAVQVGTATLLDPENPGKILAEIEQELEKLGETRLENLFAGLFKSKH